MITHKISDDFESYVMEKHKDIKKPKTNYDELFLDFYNILFSYDDEIEVDCNHIKSKIINEELIYLFYSNYDGKIIFKCRYNTTYDEIMEIEKKIKKSKTSISYKSFKNPAYNEYEKNNFIKIKEMIKHNNKKNK
jgi:hypothetical protein